MRIPVHAVAGAPESGRSALVGRLIAERARWATLAPRTCPCCIGRVEMQVSLARLLRERRPERILVVLASGEHLEAFERGLLEPPLSQYIEPGRSLLLPSAALVRPEDLEQA